MVDERYVFHVGGVYPGTSVFWLIATPQSSITTIAAQYNRQCNSVRLLAGIVLNTWFTSCFVAPSKVMVSAVWRGPAMLHTYVRPYLSKEQDDLQQLATQQWVQGNSQIYRGQGNLQQGPNLG